MQAADYLRFYFQLSGKARLVVHAFGAAALCDWLPDMRSETDPANPAGFHPQVAVIEASGGAFTPCMSLDSAPQAVVAKYAHDATFVVSLFRRMRIPVYFAAAPLWRADAIAGRTGLTPMGRMYSTLPDRYPAGHWVRFIDAGAAVEWHGRYTDTLPCEPWETCTGRWSDGTPTVVVRQADGGHFCPVKEVEIPGGGGLLECPVYMGGAARFALAISRPVVHDFHLS